jgi:hypothetical protein
MCIDHGYFATDTQCKSFWTRRGLRKALNTLKSSQGALLGLRVQRLPVSRALRVATPIHNRSVAKIGQLEHVNSGTLWP